MTHPNPPRLREQDDILHRVRRIATSDVFGFRREVLTNCLTFETAEPIRNPECTAEGWGDPPTVEQVCDEAREYLDFALDKIVNHRGLSTIRSVEKLTEYAWLLCRDDITAAMDGAAHENYGAPKVRAFGAGFGWWDDRLAALNPETRQMLLRMADGQPCVDDCRTGCGR